MKCFLSLLSVVTSAVFLPTSDHSVLPCSSTTTQDVTPSAVPSTDPQSISIHPTNDKADCVSVFNLKKIYNLSYRLNGPKRAMEANVDDQFER